MQELGKDQIKAEQSSNKKKTLTALLFLFMILVFSGVVHSKNSLAAVSGNKEVPNIEMTVTYGFGDTAKGDRYLPVWFTLKNTQDRDFSGTVEILTTSSSMEAYQYDYPVNVEKESSMEETVYIPLGVKGDQLFVILRDKNGTQLEKKRLKLTIHNDVTEIFIGVFCDKPEELQFLDEIGIHYGTLKTKLIPLNESSALENAMGYDQMDLILVTDYDLNQLSEKQQNALMQWVENGGTLLFGGGERYREGMGKFFKELLSEPVMMPTVKEVNLGVEYSQTNPRDAVVPMLCADLELKNASILISGDGFPVLSSIHKNKGRILTAAFDLRDMKDFSKMRPVFLEKFFVMILGENKVQKLSQPDYYGYSNLYFSVQGLINTGGVDRLPNVAGYTFVIILYILLIGPGLYLVLKRKLLQKFYFAGVGACSLIFVVAIYMMGAKTRFRAPFFTYATILDVTGHQEKEKSYINVRSPFNKPFTINLDSSYTARPITKSYYYDTVSADKFTGEEGYNTAICYHDDVTQLKIRDTAAFTPKIFALEKQRTSDGPGVDAKISVFDRKISGTVVNQFDYKLEDAVLLLYGRAVKLGDLEPGQRVELQDKEIVNYPFNYIYAFAQWSTGANEYDKVDITDSAYMMAQERTRLLSFYMSQNMTEYTTQARLIAFTPEKNEQKFLEDGNLIHDGLTMITAAFDVNRQENGRVYRSAFEQEPNVISGNYQREYNSMYSGGPSEPAVIEYSLGNDLEIERVLFENLSSVFLGNPQYPYLSSFDGNMYFYNYNSGHNDLMDNAKTSYSLQELQPYLSPSNTITIKYVNEAAGEYGWDKVLPMLYVIGREK